MKTRVLKFAAIQTVLAIGLLQALPSWAGTHPPSTVMPAYISPGYISMGSSSLASLWAWLFG